MATTTSVITGDIMKSRNKDTKIWTDQLKKCFTFLVDDPKYWEIYRGDSFQIELKDIQQSYWAAIYIKACIKSIKGLDVRLALGIGNKTYNGKKVTESNGEAFQFSGETLETLKKLNQNLRIKTKDAELDQELNLYFKLALISMNNWTVNSAEMIKLTLEYPKALQQDLAEKIGINQNAVSKRQKRASLDEILELDLMYRKKIKPLL
ncbi:MAG: SatD family protein [Aquaticitalea sp.]